MRTRLGLRDDEIDALGEQEWAEAAAAALWLEGREMEGVAAALAQLLRRRG